MWTFFCQQKIKTGPGMLYTVGKTFQYRISFNIIYNESGHKNMNNFEYHFFSQSSGKNLNLFKTEIEGQETAYIYHIGPFKLLVKTQHSWRIIFAG